MPLDLWHVVVAQFIERARAEGFSELDIASLRATIGTMTDRAHARPTPPDAKSTTNPGTPSAIRRSESSQRMPAIRLDVDDDDD